MVGRSRFLGVVLAVMLCLPASVHAAETIGFWEFTVSNELGAGSWGSVAVSAETDTGIIMFTVTPYENAYDSLANFGIQTFGFNVVGIDPKAPGFDVDFLGTADGKWDYIKGNNVGGNLSQFGYFEVTTDGTGNSRQNPLMFNIKLSDWDLATVSNVAVYNEAGFMFAAHIAGFGIVGSDVESHWVAAAVHVPAPGAILLAGIGTTLVGWLRRRRSI